MYEDLFDELVASKRDFVKVPAPVAHHLLGSSWPKKLAQIWGDLRLNCAIFFGHKELGSWGVLKTCQDEALKNAITHITSA